MVKKRGLGKSLDALLAHTSTDAAYMDGTTISQLPVQLIRRGKYQPRLDMDPEALNELANSIRKQGILQPLIVRPLGDQYEIIAGERRYQAAKLIGMSEVPAIVRKIVDEDAIAIALIENIQRKNLNPIEEAITLDRLITEFSMTHLEIAEAVGKSRTSVTNLIRLLNLPDEVKTMIAHKQLEMGHARTLITLPQAMQLETAQMIVARQLSVRQTENLVRRIQLPMSSKDKQKSTDPDIVDLQENLSKQFKLKVAIHCNAKGKGKLVIHYRNLRELDTLVSQIKQ